jgi:rhodanese-related sulfurtransferase
MKKSILWEILVLLAVSIIIAAGVNLLRPAPLPWLGDFAEKAYEESAAKGLEPLTPGEAAAFLGADGSLFIDARTPEEFAAGHVAGATNLPLEVIFGDMDAATRDIPKDATLIVYCSDIACGKSKELAESLKAAGFTKVVTMPEGMEGWLAAGYKTEAGQ